MARFAPVAPLQVMWSMLSAGPNVIGNYHLLLAHDVLAHPAGWKDWVLALRMSETPEGWSEPLIIMDTSVIELGKPMAMDDVLEASAIVRADVIVLPDVIGDLEATHKLCRDFDFRWRTGSHEVRGYSYMFVPQGRARDEYHDSMKFMANELECVTWVGLPRDAHEFGITSRRELIDIAVELNSQYKIHLLGMSNRDLVDDIVSVRHAPQVQGIDSAVPIRAGWRDQVFSIGRTDYGSRGRFWEDGTLTLQGIRNIEYARSSFDC